MSMSDYKIIKQIGKGSFAQVYEVEEKKTKKHYALKMIETNDLSKEDLDSIDQEIKILIQMECENSTELIKSFKDSENVYLVLELCDSDLKKEINKENGFSINKIREITK